MKVTLHLLVISFLIASCGQNGKSVAGASDAFKSKVVLGAYNDTTSYPTYNEAELKDLPRVVDLSADMSAVKDQSDRGTCTFFSTAALIEGAIKKDLKKEINISEEYLNYKTKAMGYYSKNEGSSVEQNLYAVQSGGLLLEKDWAYQPSWFTPGLPCEKYKADDRSSPALCFSHNKPDAVATPKIFSSTGLKFGQIYKNTNELIKFLAKYRRPLTLSVTVNFNGWPDTGDVYHNEDLRRECNNDSSACGGHSILITGYDLDKKVFFFKNSWGKKWGHDGFGTITIATVDNYVSESSYYATASSELAIPENYNQDPFTFEGFTSSPTVSEGKLKVAVTGKVSHAEGRLIYVSSFIVKKFKDESEVKDDNARTVSVDGAPVKATAFFMPALDGVVGWDESAPYVLAYKDGVLANPTVTDVLSSSQEEAFLRTTIYVHTDDSSYKVLKRYYQPLK